jgi:hypothetical protein
MAHEVVMDAPPKNMTLGRRIAWAASLLAALVGAFLWIAMRPAWIPPWPESWRLSWLEQPSVPGLRSVGETVHEAPIESAPTPLFTAPPSPRGPIVSADTPPIARFVSPGGGAYVVLSDWPSGYCGIAEAQPRFVVARRAAGRPPIEPHLGPFSRPAPTESPFDAWVEAGDEVIQRGVLVPASTRLFVLDDGDFFAVEVSSVSAAAVVRRGAVSWATTARGVFGEDFTDKFGGEKAFSSFPPPACIEAAWFDAVAQAVVVLGWDDRVVALDAQTGRPRALTEPVSLAFAGLAAADEANCNVILDAADRQGWPAAVAAAHGVLADESRPLTTRFHAAMLLAEHEDLSGKDIVLAMAHQPDEHPSDSLRELRTAWAALVPFLGEEAIPLYEEKLREGRDGVGTSSFDGAVMGLASMGVAAKEPLLTFVLEVPFDIPRFYLAMKLLGRLRDGASWSDWRSHTQDWEIEQQLRWWEAMSAGDGEALTELLSRHRVAYGVDDWLVVALPALRFVALHPASQFVGPLRDFKASFDGGPDATPEWTAMVRAEADAALAACSAR